MRLLEIVVLTIDFRFLLDTVLYHNLKCWYLSSMSVLFLTKLSVKQIADMLHKAGKNNMILMLYMDVNNAIYIDDAIAAIIDTLRIVYTLPSISS